MHLKFSQDIEFLIKQSQQQRLTLGQILKTTAEKGFSLIIALLVLPFLFPMPPGMTTILGSGCFLLAVQMAMGRKSPWLPRRIAQFYFPRYFSQKFLPQLKTLIRKLEKLIRPRWQRVANNCYVSRINGVCIAWLAILLMLPIPLTNPFPASGILVLAIGALEKDGMLIVIGYIFTILITLLLAVIGYNFWHAFDLLPHLFEKSQ